MEPRNTNRVTGGRRKPSAFEREEKLLARIIEALRWLDVQAPGRTHDTLREAIRENNEAR